MFDTLDSRRFTFVALLGFLCFGATPEQAAADVGVVALEGDPAPGLSGGSVFTSLRSIKQLPVINNSGRVAFVGEAGQSGGTTYAGVWLGTPDGLVSVALGKDPAPGVDDGAVFAEFLDLVLADNGAVAFVARLSGPQVTFENKFGVWAGRPGALQLVARSGDRAPGALDGVFVEFSYPAFNGEIVAFMASLEVDNLVDENFKIFGTYGLWSGTPDNLTLTARIFEQAPGQADGVVLSLIELIHRPMVKPDGELVFSTFVIVDSQTSHLVVYQGTSGSLQVIFESKDTIDEDNSLNAAWAHTNANGNLGMDLFLEPGGAVTEDNNWTLVAGPPEDLEEIAREGEVVPGSKGSLRYRFVEFGDDDAFAFGPVISRNGHVALYSAIQEDLNDFIIVAGPFDSPALVRRGILEYPAINATGDIAFIERVSTSQWRFWAGPSDSPQVVAETGEVAQRPGLSGAKLSTEVVATRGTGDSEGHARMFSNSGQVTFRSGLQGKNGSDLGQGIFVAPASAASALPSEITWYNSATLKSVVWDIEGLKREGKPSGLPKQDNNKWQIAGRGDFRGTNNGDLFWRHRTKGDNEIWALIDGKRTAVLSLPKRAAGTWAFGGVGDFNSNGSDDVLWRNKKTGTIEFWRIQNGKLAKAFAVKKPRTTDWEIGGVGDFDGNGTDDILWHNTANGKAAIWEIKRFRFVRNHRLPKNRDLTQRVAGIGDGDGDMVDDVFWRSGTSGKQVLWTIADFARATKGNIKRRDNSWRAETFADYNNDGLADIAWRKPSTGVNQIWQMIGNDRGEISRLPKLTGQGWSAR